MFSKPAERHIFSGLKKNPPGFDCIAWAENESYFSSFRAVHNFQTNFAMVRVVRYMAGNTIRILMRFSSAKWPFTAPFTTRANHCNPGVHAEENSNFGQNARGPKREMGAPAKFGMPFWPFDLIVVLTLFLLEFPDLTQQKKSLHRLSQLLW